MADNKFHGRQYPLAVLVDFGANANDIAQNVVVTLPPGALLKSGAVNVATAFNGTTPHLTVLDNSGTPISLFGSVDATAVAVTGALVAGAGHYYPFGATLTIAVSGGATTGLAYIYLEYAKVGRENEVYTA